MPCRKKRLRNSSSSTAFVTRAGARVAASTNECPLRTGKTGIVHSQALIPAKIVARPGAARRPSTKHSPQRTRRQDTTTTPLSPYPRKLGSPVYSLSHMFLCVLRGERLSSLGPRHHFYQQKSLKDLIFLVEQSQIRHRADRCGGHQMRVLR